MTLHLGVSQFLVALYLGHDNMNGTHFFLHNIPCIQAPRTSHSKIHCNRGHWIYGIEVPSSLNWAITSHLDPHCQWFSGNCSTLTPLLTWIFGVGPRPSRLGGVPIFLGRTGHSGKTSHSLWSGTQLLIPCTQLHDYSGSNPTHSQSVIRVYALGWGVWLGGRGSYEL